MSRFLSCHVATSIATLLVVDYFVGSPEDTAWRAPLLQRSAQQWLTLSQRGKANQKTFTDWPAL
eukprot:13016132-Alexandrium_andersonii.AAC.1